MGREHYTCIARILIRTGKAPQGHECTNAWGDPQTPAEPLTAEHVQLYPRAGKRAPSHRYFMVAACWGANVTTGWCSANRAAINDYLDGLYGREVREEQYRVLTGG